MFQIYENNMKHRLYFLHLFVYNIIMKQMNVLIKIIMDILKIVKLEVIMDVLYVKINIF